MYLHHYWPLKCPFHARLESTGVRTYRTGVTVRGSLSVFFFQPLRATRPRDYSTYWGVEAFKPLVLFVLGQQYSFETKLEGFYRHFRDRRKRGVENVGRHHTAAPVLGKKKSITERERPAKEADANTSHKGRIVVLSLVTMSTICDTFSSGLGFDEESYVGTRLLELATSKRQMTA